LKAASFSAREKCRPDASEVTSLENDSGSSVLFAAVDYLALQSEAHAPVICFFAASTRTFQPVTTARASNVVLPFYTNFKVGRQDRLTFSCVGLSEVGKDANLVQFFENCRRFAANIRGKAMLYL